MTLNQRPEESPSSQALWLETAAPDIDAVEHYLKREVISSVSIIAELNSHVLNAGGKRLRPALVCLSARCVDASVKVDTLLPVAASLELLHMASLVHDDVVDNTNMRRGRKTANALYGNGVSVLTGDFLLARSVQLLANVGDIRLIRAIADVSSSLAEGEVMQALLVGDTSVTEEQYLEVIGKKTAMLIEVCCRCGAIAADASEQEQAALQSYGFNLGMAFQMVDDLLDYTGDPQRIGKPCGNDLAEGKFTLPLIYALDQATSAQREQMVILAEDTSSPLVLQQMSALITELGGFEFTKQRALDYTRQAVQSLDELRNNKGKRALVDLARFVVARDV